jgi:hypothetical protein
MQKTINHTGRRKIEVKELQINIVNKGSYPPIFDVDFSLQRDRLPLSASIYIEAYQRNTLQRFNFGTVGCITKPQNRVLDQLDLSSPALFRIRIVDESEHIGRLIASTEGLRPEGGDGEDERTSLLPVRSRPLGEVTWKVDFDTGGKPELCINSMLPDAISQIKRNPQFQSLILPAALRQILIYFLWENDEENEHAEAWFRFAEHIGTERPPVDDSLTLMAWVDDVVERFCSRFELCRMLLIKMEKADD